MSPTISQPDSFKLAGLRLALRQRSSQANDVSGIPDLWKEFRAVWDQIPGRVGSERYVVISGDFTTRSDTAYYYAMIQVDQFENVPATFERMDFSNRKIAYFRHKGSPASSGQTAYWVLNEWVPASGESISENMELSRFEASFDPRSTDGEFDYGIFI
jgi:AraC family transcriptional regulator